MPWQCAHGWCEAIERSPCPACEAEGAEAEVRRLRELVQAIRRECGRLGHVELLAWIDARLYGEPDE